MTYGIIITKCEPNPDYEQQMEDYRRECKYGLPVNQPVFQREIRVLKVELTQEEYVAMKRAIMEIWT